MKPPMLKSLDPIYVAAMIGKLEGSEEDRYPDTVFTSLNAQKKAVKDLVFNMRFCITSEFDDPLWKENAPVWQILSYMLKLYHSKNKATWWQYVVKEGEFCIREVYRYKIDSYKIYGMYLDFLPLLKKRDKKVFNLVATCLSAIANEKKVWINDSGMIARYQDSQLMRLDDEENEERIKEIKSEFKEEKKMHILTSKIQNMNSTKADIINLLPGIQQKNELERYFYDFAERVISILDEPYDMEFFDKVSFEAEYKTEECEETGYPVFPSQYMTFLWNNSMSQWLEEEMECYGNEFGQVLPIDYFIIDKSVKERINYGNFIGKLAEFMAKYCDDRKYINELITSPKLIHRL